MYYKLFRYSLEQRGETVAADKHVSLFRRSRGPDDEGTFTMYRGQANAVLMHIKTYGDCFTGLVGKHSTEREVRSYDARRDESETHIIGDDDYPSAPFVCCPEISMIACIDSAPISARSAMARLHAIINHRAAADFVVHPVRQASDLRRATRNFNVVQIDYEIHPVNPHTGDLGQQLDDDRRKDYIKKMAGKLIGTPQAPIKLRGGFASRIQELQASGHSSVGFTAITENGLEIKVTRPRDPVALDDEPGDEDAWPEVRIHLTGVTLVYPLTRSHVEHIENILHQFSQ